MKTRKVAYRLSAPVIVAVLAALPTTAASQVNEGQPWVPYIFTRPYQDQFLNGMLQNMTHSYPYSAVKLFAKGDQHVSNWSMLVPFLTGVSAFTDPDHPNLDPIIAVGAYNLGNTAGLKLNANEPTAGIVLETNYLVPPTYYRQMEWYLSFRTTQGDPGIEYRPININYAPDLHQITGSSISASSQPWGANFEFVAPVGGIAGTRFAQLGWSGSGGGSINGFQHSGNATEDTLIDILAQGARNSTIQIGSQGIPGVGKWKTTSPIQTAMSVATASDFLRFYDTSANGGAVSINSPSSGNNAGLVVSSASTNRPSIVGRGIAGQTAPLLRLVDSSNTDPATNKGEVFSVDASGNMRIRVGTLNAGTGQGSATMTAPFSDILGSNGTKGVTLPLASSGLVVRGYVDGNSAANLWPGSGATINGGAINSPISIPAHKVFTATAIDGSRWAVQVGS